ncbi:MAG: non-canonical purine NTP pyrophosphatase [Planctomycetota bacterium]
MSEPLPRVLLASSNPHKLEEIQAVIPADVLEIVTLDALNRQYQDAFVEPVEDADTFEGNALLKARSYANQSGWVTIADDSGLAVDFLDGRPGVHSARYSGMKGPRNRVDTANNRKLLDELENVPVNQRDAHYVCVMAIAWPEHEKLAKQYRPPITARGEFHGRILLPEEADDPSQPETGRGDQGFGYDPLFVLPENHPEFPGTTTAELTDTQKNRLSHRGVATRALLEELRAQSLIDA